MVQPFALSVFQGATVPVKNANPISRVAKNPWQNKEVPTDHILTGGDVYTKGDVVDPAPLVQQLALVGCRSLVFLQSEALADSHWQIGS